MVLVTCVWKHLQSQLWNQSMSPNDFVYQAFIETKNNYMAVSEWGEILLCVVHNTLPLQRLVQGSAWHSVKYINNLMLCLTGFLDVPFSKASPLCILQYWNPGTAGWSGGSAKQCQYETSAFCFKVLCILTHSLMGYMFVRQFGLFEISNQ